MYHILHFPRLISRLTGKEVDTKSLANHYIQLLKYSVLKPSFTNFRQIWIGNLLKGNLKFSRIIHTSVIEIWNTSRRLKLKVFAKLKRKNIIFVFIGNLFSRNRIWTNKRAGKVIYHCAILTCMTKNKIWNV